MCKTTGFKQRGEDLSCLVINGFGRNQLTPAGQSDSGPPLGSEWMCWAEGQSRDQSSPKAECGCPRVQSEPLVVKVRMADPVEHQLSGDA